jgi:hypothetical protein
MIVNGEYQAIYQCHDGTHVAYPLVRDSAGSYRLASQAGPLPIRHWIEDLEFVDFALADGSHGGDKEKWMRMILAKPAVKPRPADARTNAA